MIDSPSVSIMQKCVAIITTLGLASFVMGGQRPSHGQPGIPSLPEVIPSTWLSADAHPQVFCTQEQFGQAAQWMANSAWHKAYWENQKPTADRFIAMTDDELRALVPPPGSLFNVGLKLNTEPVHDGIVQWAGWDDPHSVKDKDGNVYPNAQYPDDGRGYRDPATGRLYCFRSVSNGAIARALENNVLPALANAWCATGDQRYAHAAAVLLDAVAAVYPTTRGGPVDYPVEEADRQRGGRMGYAYYQAAIGLMGYSYTLDLIASSGQLDRPSAYTDGQRIRDHVIRNILWDGATFCYEHALEGYQLHNGQLDYLRGAAVVGVLLNVPELADPFLHGTAGFSEMIENNLDGDGFYFESSSNYGNHSHGMYLESADLIQAMRRRGWKDIDNPYRNISLIRYLGDSFNRAEVGGHVPMTGDAGPDRRVVDPLRRFPSAPRDYYNDSFLDSQLLGLWTMLVEGDNPEQIARLLRAMYGSNPIAPPARNWCLFNVSPEQIAMVERQEVDTAVLETDSVFYGTKGHALLRGGTGSLRHGAQLLFGATRNHGHKEALTWTFFAYGAEWSMDPGYYNTHFRFGFTNQTVAHQAMVVDQQSINPAMGSGYLLSWHDDSAVQWVMASHNGAYQQRGVTCYERLIAQTQMEDGGNIGYWLDIGRVAGGTMRDDSFHSRMEKAEYSIELPPADAGRVALAGDIDLGREILADSSLRSFQDKPFYWAPEGAGYGFLGNPREVAMPATVRATLTKPFASNENPSIANMVMTVDLAGGTGRKLIVADGPEHPAFGLEAQPYLLSRDEGPGSSTFAKLIRVTPNEADDPIESFRQLVASGPSAVGSVEPSAWCVTWKDGRRDVWVVGDTAGAISVSGEGLPAIETNGRVTFVRFSADGRVLRITSTEASQVKVENGPALHGQALATGTITQVDPIFSRGRFDVEWNNPPVTTPGVEMGALVRIDVTNGSPTSWALQHVDGNRIELIAGKMSIGSTTLRPAATHARGYTLATSISQFLALDNESNVPYAMGRPVYVDGKCIGRVSNLSDNGRQIEIRAEPGVQLPRDEVHAVIGAVGEDDEVTLPLTLHWTADNAQAGDHR